jgi:hypothetical protein
VQHCRKGSEDAYFAIPATRMAEELGRKMMANIIMLGFFTAVTGAVSINAAQNAVTESVPKGPKKRTSKPSAKAMTTAWPFSKAGRKRPLEVGEPDTMKRSKDRLHSVLIVGANPAGIAAANKLGELGIAGNPGG